MRRIREALRLYLQSDLSYSEVGRVLRISKSVVGKYVSLAKVAGVDCAAVNGSQAASGSSQSSAARRMWQKRVEPATTGAGSEHSLAHAECEAWERRHFPIDNQSAIEAIRFKMVQGCVDTKNEALTSRSP